MSGDEAAEPAGGRERDSDKGREQKGIPLDEGEVGVRQEEGGNIIRDFFAAVFGFQWLWEFFGFGFSVSLGTSVKRSSALYIILKKIYNFF